MISTRARGETASVGSVTRHHNGLRKVASPADRIEALMGDLVDYANSPADDPVTATAIVHAQFETIQPFADGNGRVGLILIGWMLHRRLDLTVPPPVSVGFLRYIGGYMSGLTLYRTVGPDEWVRWFAHTLERSAMSATAMLAAVVELVAEWPARLEGIRSDAAAHRLVGRLVTHPSLDVATATGLLDVSPPAARAALKALADTGILRRADLPGTGGLGRPRRWWVAVELRDLFTR